MHYCYILRRSLSLKHKILSAFIIVNERKQIDPKNFFYMYQMQVDNTSNNNLLGSGRGKGFTIKESTRRHSQYVRYFNNILCC